MFQPNLSIQALYVDSAGLRNSRRLRATIDAFYDILENDHQKFGDLIEAFKGIGDMEIDKTKIVERLKRWVDSIDQPDLKAKLESLTKSVEQSLPQTANLRQIVFFMTLNQLVQDQALEHLTNFEEQRLRRHATPGELREEAYQLLTKQLQQVTALIRTLP